LGSRMQRRHGRGDHTGINTRNIQLPFFHPLSSFPLLTASPPSVTGKLFLTVW
jgi:hypothetical protein